MRRNFSPSSLWNVREGECTAAGGTPASRARCTADATLSAGKRGQSVMCLQYRLVELGFSTVSATGVYDQATQDAVRFYQRGTPPLTADGVAGPRTLAALDIWSGMTAGGGRNIGAGPFPAGMQDEAQWRLTAEGIPLPELAVEDLGKASGMFSSGPWKLSLDRAALSAPTLDDDAARSLSGTISAVMDRRIAGARRRG